MESISRLVHLPFASPWAGLDKGKEYLAYLQCFNSTFSTVRSSCETTSPGSAQARLLYCTRTTPLCPCTTRKFNQPYDVKLLVKLCTVSFSLASSSLLSAPSLSICASMSLSLLRRWLRKSDSHCRILLTGTLSR